MVYQLGVWLNSTRTSRGRNFHDRHEVMRDTLQGSSRFYLFLAAVGFIAEVVVQFRHGDGWQIVAIDVPVLIALAALVLLAVRLAWRRRIARYRAVALRQGWQSSIPSRWVRDWRAEFSGHSDGFPFVATVGAEFARCSGHLPVQVPSVSVEPSGSINREVYLINGLRVVTIGDRWDDDNELRRAAEFASDLLTRDVASRTRTQDLSGWSVSEATLTFAWGGHISAGGPVELVRSVCDLATAIPPTVLCRHALSDGEVAARDARRTRSR